MTIRFREHIFDENEKVLDENPRGMLARDLEHKFKCRLIIVDGNNNIESDEKEAYEIDNEDIIVIRKPKGGGGGLWGIVIGAVLVVAGAITGNPGLIGAGVSMMAGGIVSMIFTQTPNVPKLGNLSSLEQSYAFTGSKNELALGLKVPLVYGKIKITPPIVGMPRSSMGDNSGHGAQYQEVVYCLGYKTTRPTNIKYGETLIGSNASLVENGNITPEGFAVSIQVTDGYLPTLFKNRIVEQQLGSEILVDQDPQPSEKIITTVHNVRRIYTSVIFQGLFWIDGNGNYSPHSATIKTKIRPVGANDWITINTTTYTAALNKVLRFENNFVIPQNLLNLNPKGQWEVILVREHEADPDSRASNKAFWGVLQVETDEPLMRQKEAEKLSFLYVKIVATDTNQGIINQLNCHIERKILTLSETFEYSHNPADCYYSMLRGLESPKHAPLKKIDIPALEQLKTFCEIKQFECNGIIGTGDLCRNILNGILATCCSRLILKNGLYSVFLDSYKDNNNYVITPKNSANFAASRNISKIIKAYDVTYRDRLSDYEPINEIVTLHGYELQEDDEVQKLNLFGITDHDQIVRVCRYLLAAIQNRTEGYSLKVGIEHFGLPIGYLIDVATDVLKIGFAQGYVQSVGIDYIDIDESVTLTAPTVILIYKSDGQKLTFNVDISQQLGNAVRIIDGDLSQVEVGDFYVLCETETQVIRCLVNGKVLGDDMAATLELLPYDENIYLALDQPIPPYTPIINRSGNALGFDHFVPEQDISRIKYINNGQIYFIGNEYTWDVNSPLILQNLGSLGELTQADLDPTVEYDFVNDIFLISNTDIVFNAVNSLSNSNTITFFAKGILDAGENFFAWDGDEVTPNKSQNISVVDDKFIVSVNEKDIFFNYQLNNNLHHYAIVTDWLNSQVKLFIDGYLVEIRPIVETRIFQDETAQFLFLSENTSDIFAFSEVDHDVGDALRNRNAIIKTNANFSCAEIHIYEYGLDDLRIASLYETKTIVEWFAVMANFLGSFRSLPDYGVIGDVFQYLGATNNVFENGSYYRLAKQGWEQITPQLVTI